MHKQIYERTHHFLQKLADLQMYILQEKKKKKQFWNLHMQRNLNCVIYNLLVWISVYLFVCYICLL